MADKYDPLPDLGRLLTEALDYDMTSASHHAGQIAERLGLGEDDSAEVVAAKLRKALRPDAPACLCGISRGTHSEVMPYACPVHGTPCDECGGLESCKPGCGLGYAPVDSGMDSDGTPWAVAASVPGMIVSVGAEDVLLKGAERDRFAEAVARAVTPGRVTP